MPIRRLKVVPLVQITVYAMEAVPDTTEDLAVQCTQTMEIHGSQVLEIHHILTLGTQGIHGTLALETT